MWLDRFSYYFSVKGRVGGIYSLTFEFLPDIADDRQNIDGIKQIILKSPVEKKFAVITLELTLGHDLNLSIFNSILNLPELHFSQQAQIEINHLQRALAMGENINPQQQLESSLTNL